MIYKQRLNFVGRLGALLFVMGPIAAAGVFMATFDPMRNFGEAPIVTVFVASFSSTLGAVLLLIGREYYTVEERQQTFIPRKADSTGGSLKNLEGFKSNFRD